VTDASLLETLQWQFRVGWSLLAEHHLPRMTDDSCLWLPHPSAHAVRRNADGEWIGDWHEPEPGVPWHATVGWLTWHLQGWLTGAIAEARQLDVLAQEKIRWPGNADATRIELTRLAEEWSTVLVDAADWDLDRPTTFPWPDPRPLHRLLGWVNIELMKNAAEIGVTHNLALAARA